MRLRVFLALPPAFFAFLLVWQVVLGHPWGNKPMSNGGVIFLLVFLSLLYVRLVTVKLVTSVVGDQVRVSLPGLFWNKSIGRERIQWTKVVSYNAIRDYGGYGIRSSSLGKAYIAGGHRGVLLKLKDGGQIVIGSGDPDRLREAIDVRQDRAFYP